MIEIDTSGMARRPRELRLIAAERIEPGIQVKEADDAARADHALRQQRAGNGKDRRRMHVLSQPLDELQIDLVVAVVEHAFGPHEAALIDKVVAADKQYRCK